MITDLVSDVSRHKCLIYDGNPSEQLAVIVPFLRTGIEEHWRCLYLASPEMISMVSIALNQSGIDTASEIKRGALLFSSDRGHLDNGAFDSQAMIDGLGKLIDQAVTDGFNGLCATGDMRWEFGPDKNFDRLLEYEAQLEQMFREKPLRGICQYHRDMLPARAIRDALATHRSAYIGNTLKNDNFFFTPPEILLEAKEHADLGEWMCQQLLRVMKAEDARDQTLRALHKSEARQRRLAEELAEMNRNLELRVQERTAELEIANQHLESFSYSLAHDLRSPVRAIKGFGDVLAEEFGEALSEDGRQWLHRILSNANRMDELIDGMLALARVSKASLNRTAFDLSALANEVAHDIQSTQLSRSVELAIQKPLPVVADRNLLRAAMTNLLENAWKFTANREKAYIEVGKIEQGDEAFFVKDNGAGFEMEHAGKLFGVFQRLHTQEEFPGTGVGLATVHRIIAMHGGRIWAEGSPDKGATFFFTLPNALAL